MKNSSTISKIKDTFNTFNTFKSKTNSHYKFHNNIYIKMLRY